MKKRFGASLSLSPSTIFANGKKNFSAAKMVSSGRPTLRTSPKKKNKSLPKVTTQSSSTPSNITPIDTKNLKANNLRPEEEEADNEFSHGAIAGPSSPTRRRRRPSASRRRSSSITAAAALISSYSTRSEEDNTTTKTNVKISKSKVKRRSSHTSNQADDESEDDDENDEFGGDATETVHEARKALGRGRASPYHMALVQLLFSLAQGMPLASQFKVYTHLMCRVYQLKVKPSMHSYLMLPPAPELPSDPVCQDVWVEDSTSTYAAAMATVGALVSLILLNRCSKLSEYFGRKPLLLATHILLAISTSVFRISVLLPTYVGVTVLYVAVMVMEASAGAPLKIAVQNYVVDTTSESQRAGALSFTDGFGQIGAFPSSTLGGWLAASTQQFFAPFYASIAVYVATTAYMLVFVPESKKRRHHTLIDDFERIGDSEENGQKSADQSGHTEETDNDTDADTDGGVGTESYFSSVDGTHAASRSSWWQKLFYKVNFLAPLSVFLPYKHAVDSRRTSSVAGRDWRLFVLALIVVLEESFQVFMVPILLLYNTKVFKYDVVQNGYLVSLLQGVRALYLTVCFPWLVAKIRTWLQSRKKSQESEEDETDALIRNALSNKESDNEKRGKLDLVIMLLSYILATASLALMAFTRSWSDQYEKNKGSKYPPWVGVAIAIVGLQIGAGATSLRTALLVNAVSEQEDTREALRYREQRQTTRQNVRKPYGSTDVIERRTSYQSTVTVEGSVDGTENSFNVHHDRHQSKALAANQILCTAVYAFVPLLTSRIFGIGLNTDRPELVWMFKAGMAGLSAIATFVLILLYGKNTTRS